MPTSRWGPAAAPACGATPGQGAGGAGVLGQLHQFTFRGACQPDPGELAVAHVPQSLAYRAIEFLSGHIPDPSGPGEECLLLVHIRQVVGQVRYRICPDCARGVIAAVIIDERFHSTGLGTRALSHLRSRHPTTAWRSTATRRTARDLLRRMRIPAITSGTGCDHARQPLLGPVPATS
ncbi:hypothetical protein OG444_05140 [Streptomyces sp. NBC_01232]|uniref:hypothetical protein n=1 Tax=Streptomyces sp. NBC_01232 TaxID=2903786 RepID=UPI002E10789E|nr:hypothetical protein OG444_05140 [Streptomyces sp. NBC_01232]